MDGLQDIPKGTLTLLTSGEYSDYFVSGVVMVKKDLRVSEELEKYLEQNPEQREDYDFKSSQFIAYLLREGFIEDVDSTELHLGSYGQLPAGSIWR